MAPPHIRLQKGQVVIRKRLVTLVAAALVTLMLTGAEGGCEQQKDGQKPNPKIDAAAPEQRVIKLEWYANQPYTAKWDITGGKGLYPNGEEHVAAGQFKKDLYVSKVELTITIGTKSAKGSSGWAKITDGRTEKAFETFNASSSPAVAIAVYNYKP